MKNSPNQKQSKHFYKTWKQRLGQPFQQMEPVLIYWLREHFRNGTCFDKRLLNNRVTEYDFIYLGTSTRIKASLHQDLDDGSMHIDPDLYIGFEVAEDLKSWEWRLSFTKHAFEFDVLDAVKNSLLNAKLIMPHNYPHQFPFMNRLDGQR